MARYAAQQLRSFHEVVDRAVAKEVRQIVLILLPTGRCSVEQVAKHLGVDRRTLHRQLSREAQTFSEVVNQIRVDLSARYLDNAARSLTDIAPLLGFAGSSAIARGHQTQFGTSASARRKTL